MRLRLTAAAALCLSAAAAAPAAAQTPAPWQSGAIPAEALDRAAAMMLLSTRRDALRPDDRGTRWSRRGRDDDDDDDNGDDDD